MKQALGMIETKGLVALFEATDAMLKSANVTFTGWQSVGSGLVKGTWPRSRQPRMRERKRPPGSARWSAFR